LSEAILDELAEDLGLDPVVMRKHPIFRVLKGRVLLTYPLKSRDLFPEYQPTLYLDQENPVTNTWYELMPTTENVALKFFLIYHDYTEARKLEYKITIDDEVLDATLQDVNNGEQNYIFERILWMDDVRELDRSTTLTLAGNGCLLRGSSMAIEVRTTETIDGDKSLFAAAYYDRLVKP